MIDHINHCAISSVIYAINMFPLKILFPTYGSIKPHATIGQIDGTIIDIQMDADCSLRGLSNSMFVCSGRGVC